MNVRQIDLKKINFAEKDIEFQLIWLKKRQKEDYQLEFFTKHQLEDETFEMLLNLTEINMKQLYIKEGGINSKGWRKSEKRREFSSPSSRFILLSNKKELIAFTHFQFSLEESTQSMYHIPVLYW
jgi:hypothetical protein